MNDEDHFNDADSDMSVCSNSEFSSVIHHATSSSSSYFKVSCISNQHLVIVQTILYGATFDMFFNDTLILTVYIWEYLKSPLYHK